MGAAHTMVRAALVRDARQSAPPLLLLIAMRASPIGSLAGAPRRRSGAARTQEKAAHSRAEVVLEDHSSAVDIPHAGFGRCWRLCAIFWCLSATPCGAMYSS